MKYTDRVFAQRVSHIPFHGIGLSVDVYSPDCLELTAALEQADLSFDYLEIFKASDRALQRVRECMPTRLLEYHAEGLWVTQPDWKVAYPFEEEIRQAIKHIDTLGCHWLNQECASKQMSGYSFGTYLPPVFSCDSALVTAQNVSWLQSFLDQQDWRHRARPPLFVLETPPLTYFAFGDILYSEFFRLISQNCACGIVLDIGHIWTVYRYMGKWRTRSVKDFLDDFLEIFPLERVIQIHIAGLDDHPLVLADSDAGTTLPQWIDAHHARIPSVLFEMLEQILVHPRLSNLKGLAIEVDTKPFELVVEEFDAFRSRFAWWKHSHDSLAPTPALESQDRSSIAAVGDPCSSSEGVRVVEQQYQDYMGILMSRETIRQTNMVNKESLWGIDQYRTNYLPYEVLEWGGDLKAMFPQTLRILERSGNNIREFMSYWYRDPRTTQKPYDYFLLKIQYFVDFVQHACPLATSTVCEEAKILCREYALASGYD